mgnify:CR=1 FL=1
MHLAPIVDAQAVVPPGFERLRVKAVIRETADAHSIVLEVPEDLADRFAYAPGQFLTLRVEVDGETCLRCYSLASSPSVDPDLKVSIKRVAGGRVSNRLLDTLQAGDDLVVMPPKGVFRLRDSDAPVVLFAAGSGITPVISILKQILVSTARSVSLVYANRDQRSVIFRHELARLAALHPDRFTLIHRFDDREGPLTAAAVAAQAKSAEAQFYMCGPAPFMQMVRRSLRDAGIAEEKIFLESFDGSLEEEVPSPAETVVATGDEPFARVVVRHHGADHAFGVKADETVHAAAARQGLALPFSCKAGYCGLCLARVTSGTVVMKENLGGVSDAQIAEGWTLACQARVTSPEATLVFE